MPLSLAPTSHRPNPLDRPSEEPRYGLREKAKASLCGIYKYTGAMRAQERIAHWAGRRAIAVLLFHRVTDEIPADGITIGTEWFRRMCGMLRRRFHIVPLGEALQLLDTPAEMPRRTVAITFDDCYRDNLHAAQILADHGLPACFFVPTAFVGTNHVFEWDRHLKPMPNMDWDDVRAMVRLGHEIGSHTVNHADMGLLDPAEAGRELRESKQTLETRLDRPVRFFAYPYGGRGNFQVDYLPLIQAAGYEACFSAYGGFVRPGMQGQVLPREAVPYFRTLVNLELHLSGCLDWMYALKRHFGLQPSVG